MVGGVLADRTVKDVKPAVEENKNRLMTMIDTLNVQMKEKVELRKQFVEK